MNYNTFKNILNPIFRFSNEDGIYTLKYKRVSHYDKVGDIHGYIVDLINKNVSIDIIEYNLKNNYGLNDRS